MIAAGFIQVSAELKRTMNKRFKELGYSTSAKKDVLVEVLNYKAKLGDMTINEMEQVIDYLNTNTQKGNKKLNEAIQFLKAFQNERNTQPNDGNADPVFWVIGDYRWDACWEENAEEYEIFIPGDDSTSYKWEEFKKDELEENNHELKKVVLRKLKEIEDADTLLEWVHEHIDDDAYLVPVKKNHIIREDTMFLTKAEAKRHIESNDYHYTSEVHTYAMTAWRSPQVEKLLTLLKTFDWDSIEKLAEDKSFFLDAYVEKIMKEGPS